MEYGTKEGTAFIRRPASPGTVDPVIKIVDVVFVEGVFHLFGFTVKMGRRQKGLRFLLFCDWASGF